MSSIAALFINNFVLHLHILSIVPTGKDLLEFNEQVPIILCKLCFTLMTTALKCLKQYTKHSALLTHVAAEELVNQIKFTQNFIASVVSEGFGNSQLVPSSWVKMSKGKKVCFASCRLDQTDNWTKQYTKQLLTLFLIGTMTSLLDSQE